MLKKLVFACSSFDYPWKSGFACTFSNALNSLGAAPICEMVSMIGSLHDGTDYCRDFLFKI